MSNGMPSFSRGAFACAAIASACLLGSTPLARAQSADSLAVAAPAPSATPSGPPATDASQFPSGAPPAGSSVTNPAISVIAWFQGAAGNDPTAAENAFELREAEQSRDALKREISGEEPVMLPDDTPASVAGIAVPEIDGRLEAQKRSLDSLLQKYTDEHPDVRGTKRLIQELEEQKVQIVAARKKAALSGSKPTSSILSNPVYQQLKVSLVESEATVASLRARVAEYESRLARLKDSSKVMPQMEHDIHDLEGLYELGCRLFQ